MEVRETTDSGSATGQVEGFKYTRNYTRRFKVIADSQTDTSLHVLNAVGVRYYDYYRYNYLIDYGSVAKEMRAERSKDSPLIWEVEINYSSPDGDEQDEDRDPNDTSFRVDQQVEWRGEKVQYAAEKDINGDAIVNSAGDKFDPPLMMTEGVSILVISRNEPRVGTGRYVESNAALYRFKKNSAAFWGFSAGAVLCQNISATQTRTDNNIPAFRVTYEFAIRYSADGWDEAPLQWGPNQLVSGKKVRITDDKGFPISDRLSAAGVALAVGAADVFAGPFEMYGEVDFNNLNFDRTGSGTI